MKPNLLLWLKAILVHATSFLYKYWAAFIGKSGMVLATIVSLFSSGLATAGFCTVP
jgi:hypothetical protein